MYTTMDLEGTNELYHVDNHVVMIWKAKQKFPFRGTVHAKGLQLTRIGSPNKLLKLNTDYQINADDIDDHGMSDARLKDPAYDGTLLKSVTIVTPFVAQYRVSANYQRLYPIEGKMALFNDEPIEETPDLIAYLLRQTHYFDLMLTPIKDVNGNVLTHKNPLGLEPDPYLQRPENFIKNEVHEIDVPGGVKYLHPLAHSFFIGTEKLVNLNTNTVFVRGVDYDYFCPNLYKSELSDHRPVSKDPTKPGVYEFIIFLKAFTGQVSIDYHAFGGDVTLYDMRTMMETLNNLISYVTENQFITYENLKGAPILISAWSKINKLEEQMRVLLSGRPTGADSTNGTAMKKRITCNDTDLHWYNIASLYTVNNPAGAGEVVVSDTMKLRIKTMYTGFMFDAIIAYNKLAPNNKLDVQILSEIYPLGYKPYEDYTGLNQLIRPQFRVIWNVNELQDSGAYLQIGFPLKGVVDEIIGIEDWSGTQSCWKLAVPQNQDLAYGPDDDVVRLPSTNHIWDQLNTDSRYESVLMPFKQGHVIWVGSKPLNDVSKVAYLHNLDHLLEPEIDGTKIQKVRLDLSEDNGMRYCVEGSFVPGTENLTTSISFQYNNKPAYINVRLTRASNKKFKLDIDSTIEAGITANPLYLRHVHIYT